MEEWVPACAGMTLFLYFLSAMPCYLNLTIHKPIMRSQHRKIIEKFHALALLMRWHRPIGILLLLWPTLWALCIAGAGKPPLRLTLVFIGGVVLMRSAGCVINDFADRHFDGAVARTRERPIVSGKVSPVEALILFVLLCLAAAALLWPLNAAARWLAIPAVMITVIYPFLKRITHLPQLMLGVAFSWGVPMAFAATTGSVTATGWFVFLIACIWPVAYDTLYAMVDRPDDLRIGVKSTAILFGNHDIKIVAALHLLMLLLLVVLGISLSCQFYYYLGILAAALVMAYQQYLITNREPARCFQAFLSSQWAGCFILVGLWLNYLTLI